MKRLNLQGKRFGKWLVEKLVDTSKTPKWMCKCDCGNEKPVIQGNLVRGKSISCGCHRVEFLSQLKSTHGGSKSLLYGVWLAMRRRCQLKTCKDYPNYGGRGINVCDEWDKSFEIFKEWSLQHGYKESVEIDRINNNGNYSPDNCRYVPKIINSKNKRNNRQITIGGVTKPLTVWAEETGVSNKTVRSRIGYGWKDEDLFITSKGRGANGTNAR